MIVACDEFAWSDTVYTESGIYYDTLPSAAGCDSIVTLYLTIHETQYDSLSVTSCDSYVWHDSVYTVSGIYTDTLPGMTGCDSIVTLYLTINETQHSDTALMLNDGLYI